MAQSTVTLKVKLRVPPEDKALLEETRAAYVLALNQTSTVAFEKGVNNAITLHHLTYLDVRAATGLPSNLTCSARAIVAEAYKREPKPTHQHNWKTTAGIRYDDRTLTLYLKQKIATLATLHGCVKVGLIFGDYHQQYIDGSWSLAKTATLIKQKSSWYLCLVADKKIADVTGGNVIGVDSGIKRIATVSTGRVFKGGSISQLRLRRFKQRRSLKTKPEGHKRTRNQRRLLKRLSGKETRAVNWKLWNVANGIVRESIKGDASVIVVEDLKGIRDRIRVAKKQRMIHHGWPFSSLFSKLAHVASKAGIKVESVDARNTSRTCSRCGHCDKRNRKSQAEFRCLSCGYSHNADLNASYNIRARYVSRGCAVATQRRKSVPQGMGLKPPALVGGEVAI